MTYQEVISVITGLIEEIKEIRDREFTDYEKKLMEVGTCETLFVDQFKDIVKKVHSIPLIKKIFDEYPFIEHYIQKNMGRWGWGRSKYPDEVPFETSITILEDVRTDLIKESEETGTAFFSLDDLGNILRKRQDIEKQIDEFNQKLKKRKEEVDTSIKENRRVLEIE